MYIAQSQAGRFEKRIRDLTEGQQTGLFFGPPMKVFREIQSRYKHFFRAWLVAKCRLMILLQTERKISKHRI